MNGEQALDRLKVVMTNPCFEVDREKAREWLPWTIEQLGHTDRAVRTEASSVLRSMVGVSYLAEVLVPYAAPPYGDAHPSIAFLLGLSTVNDADQGVFAVMSRERALSDPLAPPGVIAAWQAVDRLAAMASDGAASADLRIVAASGLLTVPSRDQEAWPIIRENYDRASSEARSLALQIIAASKRCDEEVERWAKQALGDGDVGLRLAGIYAVERCRLTRFVPCLETLARDGATEEERRDAKGALQYLR